MIGGSVSRTLPLARAHSIGGNDVHADSVNVKLEKGMLRVTFYHSITREVLAHGRQKLLLPLSPLRCRREPSEDVQVGFVAKPCISRERALWTDFGLNPSTCKDILNLALNRLG